MALTGFNPSQVRTSINAVIKAYDSLMTALYTNMQNQFVKGMADKWACKEAQTFFGNSFKPAVDSLLTSSDNIFSSVVASMNSAAQAWAERTGTSYSRVSFSPKNVRINTSSIKENIGGVRGIDYANAGTVIAKLKTIESSATSALSQAQRAVQSCGFVGGDQAQSLINSLSTIKSKVSQATKELTDTTQQALKDTVSNYGDLEGKVSQAFSANE